jgi:hypothetical protein
MDPMDLEHNFDVIPPHPLKTRRTLYINTFTLTFRLKLNVF